MYLQDGAWKARELYSLFAFRILEWKYYFTNDAIGDYNDWDLAWMLFTDGCSVLHILSNAKLMLKGDQLLLVTMDLLLLENQLPSSLLVFLLGVTRGENRLLMEVITSFLRSIGHLFDDNQVQIWSKPMMRSVDYGLVDVHMLDLLRKLLLVPCKPHSLTSNDDISVPIPEGHLEDIQEFPIHRSIHELKAAGIRLTRNMQPQCLTDIKLVTNIIDVELQIPRLTVTEEKVQIFLNLIAYEMCPDFPNDFGIISYLYFLKSLIHSIDDVKEFREAGVLRNAFGSDQELLSLFGTMRADLVPMSSLTTPKYRLIRSQIESFYTERRGRNKCRTWMVEAYNTYFRSPWTILAFLGALLGLFLIAVQTWYAVYHK